MSTAILELPADVEKRFERLVREWKQSKGLSSLSIQSAMHPAYQQIIGMGPAALPLILRELEREPDHWFWALKAISGEEPVPPQNRGRIKAMTEAWLEWGREHGLLPQ